MQQNLSFLRSSHLESMRGRKTDLSLHSCHRHQIHRDTPSYVSMCYNVDLLFTIADRLQWCSLCNNYGGFLILCAGCRVGICATSPDSPSGCLTWKPIVEDPKFIFYCPWCSKGRKYKLLVCTPTLFLAQSVNLASVASSAEDTATHLRRLLQI